MINRLLLAALVSFCCASVPIHAGQSHYISFANPSELSEYLRWHPDRSPLLGAHRGGPSPGFPENCIPTENLLAFVGVYEPPADVYALLHEKAICAILGTMGNLDRKASRNGIQVYVELLKNGADILATDEVDLASEAIAMYSKNRAGSR